MRIHLREWQREWPRCGAACLLALFTGLPGCGARPYAGLSDAERAQRISTMYADYAAEFPNVPDVDVDTLLAWLSEKNAVLVDARSDEEQAVSRIPGAISRAAFDANPEEFAGRPVVVYCTIGYRSAACAQELRNDGVDAYNLAGSLLAWAHHGEDFVTPQGEPTKRAHVYGPTWDLLPHNYEAVW